MSRNYEVGYKKPPKEHQFKPGQSGNKRGRPIKKLEARSLLEESMCDSLNSTVFVTEQGKRKRITVKEAISRRLIGDAMNGKISAIKFISNMTGYLDANQQRMDKNIVALMNIEFEQEHRRREREKRTREKEILSREGGETEG